MVFLAGFGLWGVPAMPVSFTMRCTRLPGKRLLARIAWSS